MEEPGKGVIDRMAPRIRASNVEPAWLAAELLAESIIGTDVVMMAGNPHAIAPERLGRLLLAVTGNGEPGVFQKFVEIFLSTRHLSWLGKELRSTASILVFDCD